MSGLDRMKQRVMFAGGDADARLSKGKLRGFKAALNNSYQAEWIEFQGKKVRCLINSDKINEDYDKKEISIDFNAGMKPGDVFYWNRTFSYWIVSLQEFSEEAYFRATIRRCDYQITLKNGSKYWVYLKGPSEKGLDWENKSISAFNDLNYTITLYVTKNEETLDFFTRHQIVKIEGHNWKVGAVDRLTQQGVLEVYLEEYFDNTLEGEEEKPNILDAIELPIEVNLDPIIDGPTTLEPYSEGNVYFITNASGGEFVVNSKKVEVIPVSETSCELKVLTGKSTSFNLIYKRDYADDVVLNVKVESM